MTSSKGIMFILLCTVFTSLGQILWKFGAQRLDLVSPSTFLNIALIAGFLSYAFGSVFMILALRHGELSILNPILATSYVWISILSPLLFSSDVMNAWKWAGIILIVASVSLLGWSTRRISYA